MQIFIATMLALFLPFAVHFHQEDAIAKKVYYTCNNSRMVIDQEQEHKCGELQDKYNLEFLCNANNTNPDTQCWVESK